jgi:hypothetical protein
MLPLHTQALHIILHASVTQVNVLQAGHMHPITKPAVVPCEHQTCSRVKVEYQMIRKQGTLTLTMTLTSASTNHYYDLSNRVLLHHLDDYVYKMSEGD